MYKRACRHALPIPYVWKQGVNDVSFLGELSNGSVFYRSSWIKHALFGASTPLHWFKLLPGIQNWHIIWHMVEVGRCYDFSNDFFVHWLGFTLLVTKLAWLQGVKKITFLYYRLSLFSSEWSELPPLIIMPAFLCILNMIWGQHLAPVTLMSK